MTKVFLLLFGILPTLIFAQLKSPSEFLGYEIGTQFTRHADVISYFEHVAHNSDMVQYFDYGKTNERRRLTYAVVSSKENIGSLESIRTNHLKNIGLMDGRSTSNKIVIWLSYNVHGNEASSSEAAMKTIYTLITEHPDYLRNVVVIMDPDVNPDGRDRYVNWYNQVKRTPYDATPEAVEHNEPWPGGRPNHYLFDLNRDWVWASQVETEQRLKIYNQWMPHIHVDFHEQYINNPYYFAPGAEPYHEMLTPWQREFQNTIGKNNAKHFDKNGWLFFTRESFDLLYPSYGDTYPLFMGAIGMTYEQAGHGRAGLGIINGEDVELTLIDRVAHHTTAGLSTIEIASQNIAPLNEHMRDFFQKHDLKFKSFVLKGNADNIQFLTEMLDKHQIQYGFSSGGTAKGYDYSLGKKGSIDSRDALVVSTNQPKGKMVEVLFEPQTILSTPVTYDITAWSLPYAFGLDAIASANLQPAETKEIDTRVKNEVAPSSVGYIAKWDSMKDAQFLSELLKNRIKVRFSEKELGFGGNKFGRGSLIITKSDNKDNSNFDAQLIGIADSLGRQLYSASSSFADEGTDFGSQYVHLIKNKKIALLRGNEISPLSYGTLWHYFETQLNYPVTSLDSDNISALPWWQYDILILPDGNYKSLFTEDLFAQLDDWIIKGGKLIAMGSAMSFLEGKEGYELIKNDTPVEGEKEVALKGNFVPYAQREMESTKDMITGSIYKVAMDNTHPLAFGYASNYFSLKLGNDSYRFLENGYNVGYINEVPNSVAGFSGEEAKKSLANSLVFGQLNKGGGSVVYLVDDVLFRSFWQNGKLIMANAVFFVGGGNM